MSTTASVQTRGPRPEPRPEPRPRWWRSRWWTLGWPVVTAAAFVLTAGPRDDTALVVLLPLLPALYAGALAVGRRTWTWPVVLLGVALCALLQEAASPLTSQLVTTVGAGALLGLAVGHGARREALVQAGGVVVFGTLALVGALAVPQVAGWALVAGWLGHGVWDLWHLHRDTVVSRTFATWCGVVDVLVGVQLAIALVRR